MSYAIVRMSNFEQRANIKFCFKLGKTSTEAHKMFRTVYGDEAVTKPTVKTFRSRNVSLEEDETSRRFIYISQSFCRK